MWALSDRARTRTMLGNNFHPWRSSFHAVLQVLVGRLGEHKKYLLSQKTLNTLSVLHMLIITTYCITSHCLSYYALCTTCTLLGQVSSKILGFCVYLCLSPILITNLAISIWKLCIHIHLSMSNTFLNI